MSKNTAKAKGNIKVYKNRELSWLQFNGRVIEEAEDEATPLLERLRFLSIALSNSDEFYRVRMGLLYDQMLADDEWRDDKVGKKATVQMKDVWNATAEQMVRFDDAYARVMAGLSSFGIRQIRKGDELTEEDRLILKKMFERQIAPLLAPFIIEKNHPFPFFESGKLVIGAALKTKGGHDRFGLLPMPDNIERLIRLPSEEFRFILAEELLLLFVDQVFHKFDVQERMIFAVIRNADISEDEGLYDYDADLRDTMSKIIERRKIMTPVKIKTSGDDCPKPFSCLTRALFVKREQIFRYHTPLDFHFLAALENGLSGEQRSSLCFPLHTPVKNPELDENGDMIGRIMEKDVLLAYPFEDFSTMIALIKQAAADERVESIYSTLYRVAHHSKVVMALIDAARNGKKVTCVVELRARFDEKNNMDWAGELEQAGCRVLYGLPSYKIHAKLLLLELSGAGRVCLIGTGNFNEATAKVYTDISLMTANEGIARDTRKVFDAIAAGTLVQQTEHLLVAPLCMKNRLIEMIHEEIEKKQRGEAAGITMKLNSLTEKEMIDSLIEASQAGVEVKLIVRGICCLISGVPGITENISVRSIVGRYLEHSRIYVFGAGQSKKYYISSADLMTRNMSGRVEAAAPVYDRACQMKLDRILEAGFSDNVKARILLPTGLYEKAAPHDQQGVRDSQRELSYW